MISERVGRIFGLSLIAWIAMIGVMAVMAGVKWNEPGFRDPDITSPLEMAMTVSLFMAIPFALVAAGLLAPLALVADRILRGRLTGTANMAAGACFSFPALAGFLAVGWLIFGAGRSFSGWLQTMRRAPDLLVGALIIFAVGGIIVSLGMRHRSGV